MKKLTINEIAEMVGVSKTTISFYLNGKTNKMSDETQKKIQQVIEETGYTPSAPTRTVKASDDCIGVILGDVSKPFAAKALKGIEEEAHEAGYQVIVGSNEMSFAKEQEYVEHMLKMGVSGFIIQATYRFGLLARELEKKNKKIVYLDIPPYDSYGVRVIGDNYQCVYDAISQCIKKDMINFWLFQMPMSRSIPGWTICGDLRMQPMTKGFRLRLISLRARLQKKRSTIT